MAIKYDELIKKHPWITREGANCILSPDSDGFLCGLLVTNKLKWNVVGFYDGKALIYKKGVDFTSCVFLDVEINRKNIGSIGNHLVEYNLDLKVKNRNFNQCIQPNILRGFDGKKNFQRKYPFGTIHLLLGLLQRGGKIKDLHPDAIGPLLFTDGVGNNLFGYPENCLDWINYLGIDKKGHILYNFLCNSEFNFYQIMQHLEDFFKMRDRYNAQGFYDDHQFVTGGRNKRTGHQIRITNSRGALINLIRRSNQYDLHQNERERVKGFIVEIANLMRWKYDEERWCWGNFEIKLFNKGMLSSESRIASQRLNNQTYKRLFAQNPFSLAMTASNRIEYSIEQ